MSEPLTREEFEQDLSRCILDSGDGSLALVNAYDALLRENAELKREVERLKAEPQPRLCDHGFIHRTCGDCNSHNDWRIGMGQR